MGGEAVLGVPEVDLGNPRIPLPESIGQFRIHGRLGRGGMGVVLDASHPSGERVALKLIRPVGDPERMAVNAKRLVREAKILEKLRHPGIVRLVDAGILEGSLVYLAMEQVLGVTLLDVRRRTAVDADTLSSLGAHLADTLVHMHEAGIVHRDIKPENVIIDRKGRAILADFGIARHEGATGITAAGEVVGSVGYLAPECFKGSVPTPKSDQYALGRLLFELCALRPPRPIEAGTPILAMFALKMLVEWDRFPSEPPWPAVERILRKMIAEDPEDRYPSAREVKEAFGELSRLRKAAKGISSLLDAASQATDPMAPIAAPVANPTVFGPDEGLSAFVDRLGLEPHSPWLDPAGEAPMPDVFGDIVTIPPVTGDEPTSEEIDIGSVDVIAVASHPPALSPEGHGETAGHVVLLPPPPDRAVAFQAEAQSTARALPLRPHHARLAVIAAVGLAAGLSLGAILGAALEGQPVPRYTYAGAGPVPVEDRRQAGELLENAKSALRAQDLDAAERFLGMCIGLADLYECHVVLGALLSVTQDPTAEAHLFEEPRARWME
jgi:serine/threonine protein kinase